MISHIDLQDENFYLGNLVLTRVHGQISMRIQEKMEKEVTSHFSQGRGWMSPRSNERKLKIRTTAQGLTCSGLRQESRHQTAVGVKIIQM